MLKADPLLDHHIVPKNMLNSNQIVESKFCVT